MSRIPSVTTCVALFLASSVLIADRSGAQTAICAFSDEPAQVVPIVGTADPHALLILAEFTDGENPSSVCATDPWPVGLTNVPDWAHRLLESPHTTALDSSVTDFYALMSRSSASAGGAHILTGQTYPKVVRPTKTILQYAATGGGELVQAHKDIITAVDQDASFPLTGFDTINNATGAAGADGKIDFIFILYRAPGNGASPPTNLTTYGGAAGLGETSFTVESGALTVDPHYGAYCSPPVTKRGFWTTVEIMAHEYGHFLFDALPYTPGSGHLASMGGYCVMQGNTAFSRGPSRMSTYLRYKLNWIAPAFDLTLSNGTEVTKELEDVITKPNLGFGIVRTADPEQYFILECVDSTSSHFTSVDECLADRDNSGLMIYHVAEKRLATGGYAEGFVGGPSVLCGPGTTNSCLPPVVEPELPQGMFHLSTHAPDPINGWDILSKNEGSYVFLSSENDQWRGGVNEVSLMTPYTNPSTNLYWYDATPATYQEDGNCARRQEQSVYSGLSFYNVQPGGGPGEIQVVIRKDGVPPEEGHTIPAGMSWQGDVKLVSDVRVPSGQTLTLSPGTRVIAKAREDLSDLGGSDTLVEIQVDGTLVTNGTGSEVLFTSSRDDAVTHDLGSGSYQGESQPAAGGDWHGLKVSPSGTITATNTRLRYAVGALNFATTVFPDLTGHGPQAGITLENNLLDVTFDRDVSVTVARTIPTNCTVGFIANGDALDGGVDPLRSELIIAGGTLTLQSGVILRSTSTSAGAGEWFGIRLSNLGSLSVSGATIRDARAAIAYENTDWPAFTSLKPSITFLNNTSEFAKDRDYTIPTGNTLTIPAGWLIGFAANRDEGSNGNRDPARCELIVDGSLDLRGVLKSDDPTVGPGSWYGVRTPDLSRLLTLSSAGSIQGAGGGVSLEGAGANIIPTQAFFNQFSGKIAFTSNRSDVCVDRDIYVPVGSTMEVPPGWRFGFTRDLDTANAAQGVDTGLAELIVAGTLDVGEVGSAQAALTSNAPAHQLTTDADWYGVRSLIGYTIADNGYGYLVPAVTSEIENAEVAGAKFGVSVETLVAPKLDGVTFVGKGANPSDPVNIYLNGTDVVVPYQQGWNLRPGTWVVASNASSNDYDVEGIQLGEADKVDLIAQGPLRAMGALTDSVFFVPDTPNDLTSSDWGGIYCDWATWGAKHRFDYVRIDHADNPLFFYCSADDSVSNTLARHFADTGIWAKYAASWAPGPQGIVIRSTDVRRGSGLGASLGRTGILLEKCRRATVAQDTVRLVNLGAGASGAAIKVVNGLHWCLETSSAADSVKVISCRAIGPGAGANALASGIHLEWACGPGSKKVYVAENKVEGWPTAGIDMVQCSDVQLTCNTVETSRQALRFASSESTTPTVTARLNSFKYSTLDLSVPLVKTDNTKLLKFGPDSAAATGLNTFAGPTLATHDFIQETDAARTDILDARDNSWKVGTTSFEQDVPDILDRIATVTPGGVDVASPDASDASVTLCGAFSTLAAPLLYVEIGGDGGDLDASGVVEFLQAGAERTGLAIPRPSPFRERVTFDFTVGSQDHGKLSKLDVYDVQGRHVRGLLDDPLPSGAYQVHWTGEDDWGRRSAAGMYFLRFSVGGFATTRKVLVLR